MLNGIFTHRFRGTFAACLASVIMLAGATGAHAGSGPGQRGVRVVVNGGAYQNGGRTVNPTTVVQCRPQAIVHGDNCGCDACCVQREYARGFSRGEAAGTNQGFRDGISGKPACAELRDDLCDNSRAYREGYAAAFGKAYRCAFEQGRAERSRACHRPVVIRPRCR